MARQQNREKGWAKAHAAERQYAINLRRIARNIEDMARALDPHDPQYAFKLQQAFRKYSQTLEPWAKAYAAKMIADVNRKNLKAWEQYTSEMSSALRREIMTAPTGAAMQTLMADQVGLITSLPLDAAERVHKLVTESVIDGDRGQGIIREILRSGAVSRSRATLIARTETARATSLLTQARAQHIGSEGYVWRTAQDRIVRPSHRPMEGKFVRWDNPPLLKEGSKSYRAHAGCIFNCRCYPEPIIPGFMATAA
jgi:SPP1 gp7 family putative phage head morphogenesis protein